MIGGEGKLFLRVDFYLLNVEWMLEIENHHLSSLIDSKISGWMCDFKTST